MEQSVKRTIGFCSPVISGRLSFSFCSILNTATRFDPKSPRIVDEKLSDGYRVSEIVEGWLRLAGEALEEQVSRSIFSGRLLPEALIDE